MGYCLFVLFSWTLRRIGLERRLLVPVVGILLGVLAFFVGETGTLENGFTLPGYHNADAKFLGECVITSVDEGIQILDIEGNIVRRLEGLSASWMYVAEVDDGKCQAVAYSNHSNETYILKLKASEDFEVLENQRVLTTDVLAIDPILVRGENSWYLTHTLIEGTINNPDPEGDNGVYTVRLYRSKDLEKWEYVTDIISKKKNIEDGDIRYIDGEFYYFFEMENYDKGPSAICMMKSEDNGKTWSEPKELLPAVADQEMASCERTEYGWRLYVSSDMACVGESYQGASVYYRDFTPDFEPVGELQSSAMPDNRAVRLYEVKKIDGKLCFLFARNFLTDCDLLLRTLESEE